MFFQKNLPVRERAFRFLIGLSIIVAGFLLAPEDWRRWSAVSAGAIAMGTGFIGFCPMCAMVGRKR